MGYNWRQTFWYAPEKAIYGVHGNSGYLFRYLPASGQVEVLDRITSEDSKRSGMFEPVQLRLLRVHAGRRRVRPFTISPADPYTRTAAA